jgi:ABC-type transport system involved in multi-copper enzyme maturation permease subunit
MFAKVLKAQWTAARVMVISFALIAFTIPLGSVFYGGNLVTGNEYQVSTWLFNSRIVGQAIPIVALVLGVLLGMSAWAADHAGRHVYALSLPVPRWQFVLLRFGAGAALLAVPVVALGAGATLAALSVRLPEGVHAYPLQLTLRFALSALLMFAIFFAISIGTRRVVLAVLGTLGAMALGDVLLGALGMNAVLVAGLYSLLTHWPGPLAILMGRWALFDV